MKKESIISMITALLILLWVYAAGAKLAEFNTFTSQLASQPLPKWSIPVLTWALPFIEILTVVLLCLQKTKQMGLLLSFLLMLSFTFYVALALGGAYADIPCSCAGIMGSLSWHAHLIFNIVFSILAFIGWYFHKYSTHRIVNHKNIAI